MISTRSFPIHYYSLRERHILSHELMNHVNQQGIHPQRPIRKARPNLPHIHQQIDQSKRQKSSSTRDRDKTRVPLVLINRHVSIVLLESAQNATEQQQTCSNSKIHQQLILLLLHCSEHPRYPRSQIRQKDRVHHSQDSFTLEMVASIHINHRRTVVHVLFSQQLQVDVAVNSAGAIAEQAIISVPTGARIADRTARSRHKLCNGPVPICEREQKQENTPRRRESGRSSPV